MSNFIIFSIDVFASIFIVALGLIVLTVIIFIFVILHKQNMQLGATIRLLAALGIF